MYATLPKPFFVLAPMDDVTDTVFRHIVLQCARPDVFVTEFVNVDGLQSPGRDKLLPKLLLSDDEKPVVAQLWGLRPENFEASAYEVVKMGYDGVDLNMGCPDKTVVKNGACSALITNRDLAHDIIEATRRGVQKAEAETGRRVPLSVKTRLGSSSVDLTWHEFLLGHKLDALTVHFRTRAEMSKVPARWEFAADIKALRDKLSPNTVLIGNGDVTNRAHGLQLAAQSGFDGIMIGRGVFADPYCFAEQSPWESMLPAQKLELYKRHVLLFAETWPSGERKLHTLNRFCKIYVNGFDGAKELRESIMNAPTLERTVALIDESLANYRSTL